MSDERPSSPRYRALIQLLRTAEDLWNSSRVFFNRWELSPSQFNVLNLLHGEPDGLSQSDLSRMLLMHRSNATGLIDRLEKRSLVRREAHPTDRRAYRVVLTPAGTTLVERIHPHYFAAAERVWSSLPDEAVEQFLNQLQEINAHAAAVAAVEAATPPEPGPTGPVHTNVAEGAFQGQPPARRMTSLSMGPRRTPSVPAISNTGTPAPMPSDSKETAGLRPTSAASASPPTGTASSRPAPLGLWTAIASALLAACLFHAGYHVAGGWPILAFFVPLVALTRLASTRAAFYTGLALGLAMYAPHLAFFWTIFGPAAFLLWLVLAFWIAAFLGVGRSLRTRIPFAAWVIALPVLWTGFEFFRSELYFLRFSWLTPAMALVHPPTAPSLAPAIHALGGYGVGFTLALAGSLTCLAPGIVRWTGPLLVVALMAFGIFAGKAHPSRPLQDSVRSVTFAGAQIETVSESGIVEVLDQLVAAHPQARLVILPEYSLSAEPGPDLGSWCRNTGKHLIVGGKEPLGGGGFRNTAFVIDTNGVVVFRQAKSVPIQFFDDGVPADSQGVWDSPWGRIGIGICYDLSYTRVIDGLVRSGAEALVIPTMDDISWGAYQHALHARIAPLRALEHGIPVARVASSGVSQEVDRGGVVRESAPFSEDIEFIRGTLEFRGPGTFPLDRHLALVFVTLAAILTGIAMSPRSLVQRLRPSQRPRTPRPAP